MVLIWFEKRITTRCFIEHVIAIWQMRHVHRGCHKSKSFYELWINTEKTTNFAY